MADRYIRSVGGGSGAWGSAYTTLAAAFAAGAAGDNFWVADDHAEISASADINLTCPGTISSPCIVACVNHLGSQPPVAADLRDPFNNPGASATINTSNAWAIGFLAGYVYYYGIQFNAGSGANNSSLGIAGNGLRYFKNCQLRVMSLNNANLYFSDSGQSDYSLILDNTAIQFGSSPGNCNISISTFSILWKNTPSAILGSVYPTTLVNQLQRSGKLVLDGVDLSALGSGKTLFYAFDNNCTAILRNCRLGSGVTVCATPVSGTSVIDLINCDSGNKNYRNERYAYAGTQKTEETIVRTGGASDGIKQVSWRIDPTANSKWQSPFECPPIAVWNDNTTGNVTVTVYGVWDSLALPNNDDIWIEVSYMNSSTSPIAAINASNTIANFLSAPAHTAQATDSSTWVTTGLTNPNKFKLQTTIIPQMKGLIYVTVKAAKPSSTFYVDPIAFLS